MTEETRRVLEMENRVSLRRRALALQDGLASCILVAVVVAGALTLAIRFGLIPSHVADRLSPQNWPQTLLGLAAVLVLLSALWSARLWLRQRGSDRLRHQAGSASPGAASRQNSGRDRGHATALFIDAALQLDDRFTTSHSIISRGEPQSTIESAVIDDTVARLGNAKAAAVVPYRPPSLRLALRSPTTVSLAVLAALGSAALVLERARSAAPPAVASAEVADAAAIESAGDRLAQSSEQVAESLAAERVGGDTARLAREQSELGRALRQQNSAGASRTSSNPPTRSKTEALRALSSLEERIQARQGELSNTHAAEIVSLAERRLGDAVGTAPTRKPVVSPTEGKREGQIKKAEPPAEAEPSTSEQTPSAANNRDSNPAPAKATASEQNKKEASRQEASESGQESNSNPLADKVADQAARVDPNLSAQLVKKAAELRADKLTAQDIERFKQAAQAFAKDLPRIANSPEFQKAVEQLARQVTPEQIEAVAKQLMANEKLRDELQAAARLLAENQEAKAMISGLRPQLEEMRRRLREQGLEEKLNRVGQDLRSAGGGQPLGGFRGTGTSGQPHLGGPNPPRADRLSSLGRGAPSQTLTGGAARAGSSQDTWHDDALYLRTKPGSAPVRVPYSSAYPQYRRQAEASVARSHVPRQLRSLVRNYFDAINPDKSK